MSNKKIISKLTYGVFVCTIIGFLFSISIGVKNKEIYNYIIAASNCLLLTSINCLLMLIEITRYHKRTITKKNLIIIIPYSIISFIIGLIYMIILNKGFNIEICNISRIITALYQTLVAVIISTILSNVIISNYEKSIKYRKRTFQDKIKYN